MKTFNRLYKALIFLSVMSASQMNAQSIAIAPSRLYYKVGLGDYKNQTVTITNNSGVKQSFTISFTDFEAPGTAGKSKFMGIGESENSCSKWLSATPSYFEIEPGQSQQLQVLMQVPNTPDANKVKWSAMRIKLAKEKTTPQQADANSVGMGITETLQFVVHIFQSPPSVTFKNAEITSFKEISAKTDTGRVLSLFVKNTGQAILDCASYIEITNLQTGLEERLKPFAYTVLPGGEREVQFHLPVLQKSKYSILGVVDYGSRENVQAAEITLDLTGNK